MKHAQVSRWRIGVQSGFLLAWLDPFMLRMHGFCSPVFHCYSCPLATFACPIGALANFSAIHSFPFIALGTLLLFGALFGSLVCGWACPFGFLQDLLGKIPTRKFELPRWAGWVRIAVLVGLVGLIPYCLGEDSSLFFCRLCPAGALEAAVPNVVNQAVAGQSVEWPSAVKIGILAAFLVSALFVWRPWCTLFCPLGAIYGLFNHVSLFVVRFQPEHCTDCDLCHKTCRYGGGAEGRAGDLQCNRCLECMQCDALTIGTILGNPAPEDRKT